MSDLLKMSLIQTNPWIARRTHAAVVQVAQAQRAWEGAPGAFSQMVLSDVSREWSDFIAAVAADQAVRDATVINEDSTAVVTSEVEDATITAVVTSAFAVAAAKYAPVAPTQEQG